MIKVKSKEKRDGSINVYITGKANTKETLSALFALYKNIKNNTVFSDKELKMLYEKSIYVEKN